jgi:hypothetical protein
MPYRHQFTKVKVVTLNGTEEFDSLKEAQIKYPHLDLYRGCKDFTNALQDDDGSIRFESWDLHNALDRED